MRRDQTKKALEAYQNELDLIQGKLTFLGAVENGTIERKKVDYYAKRIAQLELVISILKDIHPTINPFLR